MPIDKVPGKPAPRALLVNVPGLVSAFFTTRPDPNDPAQRVAFGTSGHRGSALTGAFNEAHILAITQAIVHYRRKHKIDGPLFLAKDTHALSEPAFQTALEVLAANDVATRIALADAYTPTPALSFAILAYNRARPQHAADGIVITPSHNPPKTGDSSTTRRMAGPLTAMSPERSNATPTC